MTAARTPPSRSAPRRADKPADTDAARTGGADPASVNRAGGLQHTQPSRRLRREGRRT